MIFTQEITDKLITQPLDVQARTLLELLEDDSAILALYQSDNKYKKPKSRYFTKRIDISKTDLEDICNKLNLSFDKLSFLSSGSFGNAYKIGDKVLKITSDKSEAKTAYDITKNGQRKGIVNYYKVAMYKVKNKYVYVIVMEYVRPLSNPSSENIDVSSSFNYYDFVWDVTEIMYNNWGKINSKEEFLELVSATYELPNRTFGNVILDRLFDLYQKVKKYKYVDIHPHNLGIRKDRSFVLFDFSEKKSVRKFDTPEIL